ncbi:hypothetical protein [Streptomyces sp. NPDC001292]|uniref:hypothetical protein n=1 Tax=Streptomyces sp. NPDC001292 TaxID=3364558 RepID=UPI0036C162F5
MGTAARHHGPLNCPSRDALGRGHCVDVCQPQLTGFVRQGALVDGDDGAVDQRSEVAVVMS